MINKRQRVSSNGEPMISAMLHTKAAKAHIPIAGNFELTPRCNFRCKMCYVHQERKVEEELSAKEWIAIIKMARDKGMLFALLTGGEPLLRPDFKEIYLAAKKMGLMVSINTNASLITDEIFEMFCENPPLRINISLYGGDDITYKNLCGVAEYETVTKNIVRLKKAGISVKLNCSVTPYNGHDIEKIYDFAKKNHIRVSATTYMYPPVRINGKKYGDAPARFCAEEAAKYMLHCKEQYLSPEQLKSMVVFPLEDEECTDGTGLPMQCRAGRTSFWVTWKGCMLPCGMFPNEGHFIPEVGFEKAWEEVQRETNEIIMPAECTGCTKKERCVICAASCLAETGDTRIKPEYICRMTYYLDEITMRKYGDSV